MTHSEYVALCGELEAMEAEGIPDTDLYARKAWEALEYEGERFPIHDHLFTDTDLENPALP